jgi:hypothetical protein
MNDFLCAQIRFIQWVMYIAEKNNLISELPTTW